MRSPQENPYATTMFPAVRTLTVVLALVAHLLLAGVQIPHCHATHDSAGDHQHADHQHAERGHDTHAAHARVSHSHHQHAHTHMRHVRTASQSPSGLHHSHHSDDPQGRVQERCHADDGGSLADHGINAAIPPRVERGTDRSIDLVIATAMPLAATSLAIPAGDGRQAMGRASHGSRRVSSLHDLLPHVLRL